MKTNLSGRNIRLIAAFLFFVWAQPWRLAAQGPEPAKGVKYSQIGQADLKEWLTYLSSDDLAGRQGYPHRPWPEGEQGAEAAVSADGCPGVRGVWQRSVAHHKERLQRREGPRDRAVHVQRGRGPPGDG